MNTIVCIFLKRGFVQGGSNGPSVVQGRKRRVYGGGQGHNGSAHNGSARDVPWRDVPWGRMSPF